MCSRRARTTVVVNSQQFMRTVRTYARSSQAMLQRGKGRADLELSPFVERILTNIFAGRGRDSLL